MESFGRNSMQEKKNNLEACWKRKHEEAVKKAKDAIAELVLRKEPVNFNSNVI